MNLKKTLAVVAGVGGLIYIGSKLFGNSEEEVKNNTNNDDNVTEIQEAESQAEDDEIYKKIKIDRKKYCDNVQNDSDFLKKIYSGMRFNPRFDIDVFDVVDAYNSDFTIAITEGEEEGTTDIQCRLVNVTKTDKNSPKVPDYIRCIKNATMDVSNTWNRKLIKNQKLFVYFKYTNSETGKDAEVIVPSAVYEEWAKKSKGGHGGEVEFLSDFTRGDISAKRTLTSWLETNKNVHGIVPGSTYMYLAFTTTVFNNGGIAPVLDIVEKVLATDITRNNGNSYHYDYVLVYAPNKEGVIDFTHFYDVDDEENKVIILELTDDDNE
jgi:hypothetical protein